MTSDIFLTTEQVIISAIKAQIQSMMHTKQMFWNGVVNDCVIAGGVFASLINDEPLKDIDVFILNKNVSVYAHLTDNNSIHEKWKIRDSGAGGYLQNPHIHGVATNLNTKVQYILTDYATREELLKDFDYKHTTVSYVPKEMKLYITRGAFDAIRNKELVVNGHKEPKVWRESKFVKRGWRTSAIDHHQALKESFQHLNDKYDQVIKDALGDMLNKINPVPATMTIKDDTHGIVAQAVDDILYGSK